VFARPAAAQGTRWTVEPVVGYRMASDLYRHEVESPAYDVNGSSRWRSRERLRLAAGPGGGVRLGYAPSQRWRVFTQALTWRSQHDFLTGGEGVGGAAGGYSWSEWTGAATVTALTAGVHHTLWQPRRGPAVGLEADGGFQRASLRLLSFPVLPPSVGFSPPAPDRYAAVAPRYDVPSGGAAVTLAQPVGSRVMLTLRSGLSVGRVDTRAFQLARLPDAAWMQEPSRFTTYAASLALGAQIRVP
jgi:hypothetical protein